jgi:hypothetical protein
MEHTPDTDDKSKVPDTTELEDCEKNNEEPKELTELEKAISEITGLLMNLNMVTRTSYSGENHYDTTPHKLTIVMEYHTDRENVKTLGKVVASLVKNITSSTIKASVEHPYRHIEDDDGNQNIRDNKHIDKISIRWNERWATTPANIRGPNGEVIDISDVDKLSLNKIDEMTEQLLKLDLAHQENKIEQLKQTRASLQSEEETENTI